MKQLTVLALAAVFAGFGVARADTNVALSPSVGGTNGGVAIFGYNDGSESTLGTPYDHSGGPGNLNDGVVNGNNGDDTWPNNPVAYIGAEFTLSPNTQIDSVVFYGRNFADGGWFGVSGTGPLGTNGTLTTANLIAPTLQYTTDGGVTWITDNAVTSDYVTAFTGATANGGAATNPATFTLTTPLTSVDGIRLIGETGGYAGNNGQGFLGADEIEVFAGAVPEPSTWAMMLGGAALLGWMIRRRTLRA